MSIFDKFKSLRQSQETYTANFYFYFTQQQEAEAKELQKELTAEGFSTNLGPTSAKSAELQLTATREVSGIAELHDIAETFEEMAALYGYDYDGHDMAAEPTNR